MSSLMRFEVLAPDKYVLKSDAISYVEAVTLWGGVGILPRHAPLIAALKEAPLKYRDAEGIAHFLCIQGGFMEVKDNKVVVMTEAAETADEIDVDRAEASRYGQPAPFGSASEDRKAGGGIPLTRAGQTTGWSVSVRFTEGFVRNYIRTNLFFIKLFVILFAEFSLISISLRVFS